jgi:hypothetical protein
VKGIESAPYTLVLTHDVDHLSVRGLPFLGRAQLALVKALLWGSLRRLIRGRISLGDYLLSLAFALRLPLVLLRLLPDPFEQSIERIMQAEGEFGVRSTFYFIPFKGEAGHVRPGEPAPKNRAANYRLAERAELIRSLVRGGWEVGVHGLDCHVSAVAADGERLELAAILGPDYPIGARMHWLYSSPELRRNLARAGFAYDATLGWNDRIGFPRADEEPGGRMPGSSPAYLPFADGETGLPVLPLNIQDVALLRSDHLDLGQEQAWQAIENVLAEAKQRRATVTVSWHNDSFLPPRSWAGLYSRILARARTDGAKVCRAIDALAFTRAAGAVA